MPEIGDNLVGFHIEFCFSYNAEDGSNYLAWIEGVIESIVNAKQRTVMIRWNEEKVAEGNFACFKTYTVEAPLEPKKCSRKCFEKVYW
jgi:hypothetical protein